MVSPANNTLSAIRTKVRRLTASPGESTLPTTVLDEYINGFYSNDFPYTIKIDQMRDVYSFYTTPYVDRYPLDVNYNQGVRDPFYCDGIQGTLFKDRSAFYRMWPELPTYSQQTVTTFSKAITGATALSPVRVNSTAHGLSTGAVITISGVTGMTDLNGGPYTITVVNANTFTLNGIDGLLFSAYTGGGTWFSTSQDVSFTLSSVPFIRKEVTIGGQDVNGNEITVIDDGYGNLLLSQANPVIPVPLSPPNPPLVPLAFAPIPGMINNNSSNPGLQRTQLIGTVDYVTGVITYSLPTGVAYGPLSTIRTIVSQYQPGRPYSLLFWNNEFHVRPIPKYPHKITVEVYLTPVQFMAYNDTPILNQWWQYIAIGTAKKILEDRQDFDGVANIMPMFKEQEGQVLERQGIEEIGQRNSTIYSQNTNGPAGFGSWYGGFY